MVQDIITVIIYIFNRFINLLFSLYIVPNVSVGMIIIVTIIFAIILRYLLAVPSTQGGQSEKGSSGSGSSSS